MRAVLHQDIVALARCLLPIAPLRRRRFAALQVQLTHAADGYRAKFGKPHPIYGNGTLMSCCQSVPKDVERQIDDVDYADCLVKALEAVIAFRMCRQRPDAQSRQSASDGS